MEYEIVNLPKEKWKGTIIPIGYKTDKYYDVIVNKIDKGFTIEIEKKDFTEPVIHTPEEYDFSDKLYQDYWENAYAWGVLVNDELVAAIETDPELWSNRLRITELWVAEEYQKQGIGHGLIEMAKEQARRERRRAIILETQSCNVNAVDFYQHEGFSLIGMDTCCYKNNDLQRKEVRLEFGWFAEEKCIKGGRAMGINLLDNTFKEIKLKDEQQLIIRKPELNDADDIIDYLNIVGGESDNLLFGAGEFRLTVEQERAHIENINKDTNCLMILGTIDNKIVSVAQISAPNRKRIEHNSEIAISVKKEYWGIGVGSAMMKELIQFAKEHISIKNISLGVRSINHNAIKLYEKYGFQKIGVHKHYFNVNGNYYDEILMDLQVKF